MAEKDNTFYVNRRELFRSFKEERKGSLVVARNHTDTIYVCTISNICYGDKSKSMWEEAVMPETQFNRIWGSSNKQLVCSVPTMLALLLSKHKDLRNVNIRTRLFCDDSVTEEAGNAIPLIVGIGKVKIEPWSESDASKIVSILRCSATDYNTRLFLWV